MAQPFTMWQPDYEALTQSCGLVVLKDWTHIVLTGNDRVNFLHNMCTNDIRGLSPGNGCEAFCTDVKGKVLGHIFVLASERQLDLLTVPDQATALLKHFDHYLIREDVQLSDETPNTCWVLICGGETPLNLERAFPGCPTERKHPWQHWTGTIDGEACGIARANLVWPLCFLVCTNSTGLAALAAKLPDTLQVGIDGDAWQALRVESSLSLFGVDFDSAHLPQEINRDSLAIHLNKGCYLGQETVARLDALGHVNKKLVLLQLDSNSIPASGTEHASYEDRVATVTSSCWSPQLQAPLELAWVRRGFNDIGSTIKGPRGNATVIAPVQFS